MGRLNKLIWFLILFVMVLSIETTQGKNEKKKELVFSRDYFTENIVFWQKYLGEYAGKPNVKYLEIGVFEGRSAFWILENILTGKGSTATLVDPFFSKYEQTFLSNLNSHPAKEKVVVIKDFSENALRKLPQNHFDIIYIDGSHMAKSVFMDAAYSWELLKEGALLIFDDLPWRRGDLPIVLRPESPIEAFLVAFGEDVEILHKDWQVIVKKRKKPLGSEYLRLGNCTYYWLQEKLVDKNGKKIKIAKALNDTLKDELKKRQYGLTTTGKAELPLIKHLSVCEN